MLVSAVLADAQQTGLLLRSHLEVLCSRACVCCCIFSRRAGRGADRPSNATSAQNTATSRLLHSQNQMVCDKYL